MVEKPNQRKTVQLEEVVMNNVYTQETIVNLLEEKGIISKKEVVTEIARIDEACRNKSRNLKNPFAHNELVASFLNSNIFFCTSSN